MKAYKLGAQQLSAVEVYVADPAHDLDEEDAACRAAMYLSGDTLYVTNPNAAANCLLDASNSAGDDGDRAAERALLALMRKVRGA